MRDRYRIVRVDSQVQPAGVAYVGYGETPHDLHLVFVYFTESAAEFSNRVDCMREARRVSRTFTSYRFIVRSIFTSRAYASYVAGRSLQP